MTTRRDLIKTAAATAIGATFLGARASFAAAPATSLLSWKAFAAGEGGFFRAPALLSGAREAVLIDGGFTLPDGKAMADAIRASGKTLTTIYISQSDPDYYFSLAPIKAAFPSAKVIAASATVAAIKGNVERKLATWGPQLKRTARKVWPTSSCQTPSMAARSRWKGRQSTSSMQWVCRIGATYGCRR